MRIKATEQSLEQEAESSSSESLSESSYEEEFLEPLHDIFMDGESDNFDDDETSIIDLQKKLMSRRP